ncbi:MAG: hypothetical protein KIT80_23150 [Chitinophagaceae bacterium]|nr:hypothetical protein [Chitinophagaceae bacterium]MCW5929837.1 hypothetical protein [Chitinophagaceae bacterium]
MPGIIALLVCCVLSLHSFSQQSDFITFRKKGRVVTNYFKGMPLDFIHINGSRINGVISRMNNDTIFMTFHDVAMRPTYWGTAVPDTLARYDMRFHYKEIAAMPKPGKSFEFIRNGLLLQIVGIGWGSLHTINGLIQKSRIDPMTVAVAGGITLVGYGIKKTRKYTYPIGEKYTIDYIKLTE